MYKPFFYDQLQSDFFNFILFDSWCLSSSYIMYNSMNSAKAFLFSVADRRNLTHVHEQDLCICSYICYLKCAFTISAEL
jgi:hypothetical protein